MRGRAPRLGLRLAILALTLGCAPEAERPPRQGEPVLVSAAASLASAFREMELAFEASHPEIDVRLNPAASSVLREQILGGAPVGVFASADEANMDRLAAAGFVSGRPRTLARSRLSIAVPAGNPAGVRGLADFARPEPLLGLCVAAAPCGTYAQRSLAAAGVTPSIDTREPNARALLAKVAAGEIDAGLVYAADIVASDGVDGIPVDAAWNVDAVYAIAVLESAPNRAGAAAFVAFALSEAGRTILTAHGFAAP